MHPSFYLVAACFALIAGLVAALPDLKTCGLPQRKWRPVTVGELCILVLICAVYSFFAFRDLGNTVAPTSFAEFQTGSSKIIELPGDEEVSTVSLYSGINVGSFTVEFSVDGENYESAAWLQQSYAEVLRWHRLDTFSKSAPAPRFVRISCTGGDPRLGEAAFFNASGELITPLTQSVLTDEQRCVPLDSDFMNSSYFDEIYHVRTAVEHIEGKWPYELSHPPLGKTIISLGIRLFGLTPFGWRFSGTFFGLLMVPLLYFFARSLFGKKPALCCAVVFAFDFMHFSQTRIATIDTYGVFFILLMYWMMYLYITEDSEWKGRKYLALSGVFFGLGAASKWTAIYAGVGLAVIWLAHWLWKYLSAEKGSRERVKAEVAWARNVLFCLVWFVAVPAIIYYLSYIPYGRAKGMSGIGMLFNKDYLRLVLDNQSFMLSYHANVKATHPYSSRWYQWLLDIRPILYYLGTGSNGTRQVIGAIVSPLLCWGGLIAVFIMGIVTVVRRDRTAGFVFCGYLAQLVPWMFVERIVFEYHYFPCTVFLTLALGYLFSLIERSSRRGRLIYFGFTAACFALFLLFYPVLSGESVSGSMVNNWLDLLPTWPF